MIGVVRPPNSNRTSESGAIGVGTLIGVALLVLAVYLLLGAAEADTAHYGRVPVPSISQVELPEGETDVYYAEGIEPDSGVSLAVPLDLDYSITDSAGQAVQVSSRGDDPEETDGGMARLIGSVSAPAEGIYTVKVVSDDAAQRISPTITFGQSPFGAIEARFDEGVEAVKGPAGIVVVALLFVLLLLPRFRRALASSRGG